tara:strand:- start:717 stop:1583 length:867 start_codon:yes stop_codon:yes gene_type:complete
MYYPKSQIETNLFTPGQEFSTLSDNKEYIGNYWRTSQGLYYTGTNPQDNNVRVLTQNRKYNNPGLGSVDETNDDAEVYVNMLPESYTNANGRRIRNISTLINSVPLPTKTDYTNENFQRYFLKRTTNYSYLETSKNTYTAVVEKNNTVQYDIYDSLALTWKISGKLLDVYKQNYKTVQYKGNVYNWIKFNLSFKNRYARYYKPSSDEPNYTKGGELKVEKTNEEYIGYYHFHPKQGSLMEGKKHMNSFHYTLVLIEDGEVLTKKRIGIDEEVGTSRRTNISPRGSGGY